jgi:putative ATP-binding cassette transporter
MNTYLVALKILWPTLKVQKKLSALVFIGTIALICLSAFFTKWYSWFYNALQNYESQRTFYYLGMFIVVAMLYVFISGMTTFWTRYLEFGTRQILFDKYTQYYKTSSAPNMDQRLCDDMLQFPRVVIAFIKAGLNAGLKIPIFLYIMYSTASVTMMLIGLVYALIGTILSRVVAKPLVELENQQQTKESELRRNMIHSIEGSVPLPTLEYVKLNWVSLAKWSKYLQFFVAGYGQLGTILPFLFLLPMYFAKKIMLGDLFSVDSAMGKVLDSLSVLIDNRDLLIEIQMVTNRISMIEK